MTCRKHLAESGSWKQALNLLIVHVLFTLRCPDSRPLEIDADFAQRPVHTFILT